MLYKDMLLMRGNAISRLKPATVITGDEQKNFFFELVDDFGKNQGPVRTVGHLCVADPVGTSRA